MTIKETIEKAINGGFEKAKGCFNLDGEIRATASPELFFLDPEFWKALGKAMGIYGYELKYQGKENQEYCEDLEKFEAECKNIFHNFIDHLWEGGTLESFFESLNS